MNILHFKDFFPKEYSLYAREYSYILKAYCRSPSDK